jgi:hypothetical protein
LATALLSVGLAACDDDSGGGMKDMSVNDDLSMKADAGEDMAMQVSSTAQITVADVVGVAWQPVGENDGGAPIPLPVHSLAVVADFPVAAGEDQNSSGSTLNGCTWDRYDLTSTDPTKLPGPNENAGIVTVTGYDTQYSLATDVRNGNVAPPDPTITCASAGAPLNQFGCFFGSTATNTIDNYIFVQTPFALAGGPPAGPPSPTPTPFPTAYNSDLFLAKFTSATPPVAVGDQVTETFTHMGSTTFSNDRTTTLTGLPDAPTVASIKIDGTATTTTDLATELNLKFDGNHDITIAYSCDGTTTAGSGCKVGGITGLLIQTSQGKKWESFSPSAAAGRVHLGAAQCVDATGTPGTANQFTLPKAMIGQIVGSDTNQSIRVVLVRLKANQTASGTHPFFQTGGKGIFAFIDQ